MDGKKKKNKKKKGNIQNRVQDDVPPAAEQSVVTEGDDGSVTELNHIQKSPCVTDAQNVGVSELNSETDIHKVYEDRFVQLQEVIRQLEDEKNQRVQKEVNMEEKIKLLQNVIDTCINKEAGLEEILKEIQKGNHSIMEKEAMLENKVRHIEGMGDLWILKETEVCCRLDEVKSRLQEQVKESRDGLAQENIGLKEMVALVEARLDRLECESALTKSTLDIIREKLPAVEAADIEKVKEVHVEQDVTAHENSVSSMSGVMDNNNPRISEDVQVQQQMPIPITDAPLIGAPFRIVSFFTRYVTGADLLDKETSTSA